MFLVAFLYILFASTFTIGKLGLQYSTPFFYIGVRMLLAGLLLLSYLWLRGRLKLRGSLKHFWWFAGVTIFHIYFAYICEFWALRYLTAAKTCLLYNLSPFISALFSYFYFSEKMTPKKWVGLGLGFLAFVPIFINDWSVGYGAPVLPLLPELLMLGSVVSAVYGWTIVRYMTKKLDYEPIFINGIGMTLGGFLALLTAFAFEKRPFVVEGGSLQFILWVGVMVVVANFIGYNLYGHLLKKYTATLLSFAGFSCPLFAAIFGWFFLGEPVRLAFGLTLFIVSIALYIFYQEELKQGYVETK